MLKMSRIKEVLIGLMLCFVSCVMCFVILEITVRALHLAPKILTDLGPFRFVDNPDMIYEFIPGSTIDGSRINAQGFKDSDFVLEKRRNLIRIAMIGDSITQGMGVALGKTFSDQLESLLNKRAAAIGSEFHYEVMNFGVGGYNLGAEVEVLRTKAVAYQPDIVVWNFFHNDNEPFPGIQLFFIDGSLNQAQKDALFAKYYTQRHSLWRRLAKEMLNRSRLYAFCITRLNSLTRDIRSYVEKHHNSIAQDEDSKAFLAYLTEIKALSKKYNFKFIACLHPHLLFGEHPNNKKFADALRMSGMSFFDMYEYYQKANVSAESIQLPDKNDTCHPNEFGHSIIARAMMAELKKHGLI